MKRTERQQVAQATVTILTTGEYTSMAGRVVTLKNELAQSVLGTELVRPAEWPGIADAATVRSPWVGDTLVEVTRETTLGACRRLVQGNSDTAILALNFASAKNPGGGFLNGSQAQEESLARASGLYPCLQAQPEYYVENRACESLLYTDHAIHSPAVPVFRDDAEQLLDAPFPVGFITIPAPNLGAMAQGSPERQLVPEMLARRAGHVVSLAVARGYRRLVLGAWGCGVFRNDPAVVADAFAAALAAWAGRLEHVVFAVYDNSPEALVYRAFERRFAAKGM